jgi:hypothetical protein
MMNAVWVTIGETIWKYLQPWLEKKWAEVEPKILPYIGSLFEQFAPKILKTILVGISTAAGQLTIDTTDKITKIIPGPVDDAIVDHFVDQGRKVLGDLGIRF